MLRFARQIPDGDTGTNMAMACKGILRRLDKLNADAALSAVTAQVAEQCLISAAGNSGTILTHFFSRLAVETQAYTAPSLEEFATALRAVGATMMGSIAAPKRGTLLSVISDACAATDGGADSLATFYRAWHAAAREAVDRSPDELEVDGVLVLKKKGVVDSGALGFVYLLEGPLRAYDGTLSAAAAESEVKSMALPEAVAATTEHADECQVADGRYCTEFVVDLGAILDREDAEYAIASRNRSPCPCLPARSALMVCGFAFGVDSLRREVEAAVSPMGTSVVSVVARGANGGTLAKVHIHTDTPQNVFDVAARFGPPGGKLRKEKVEDMLLQSEMVSRYNKPALGLVGDTSNARCGIIASSAVDLPSEISSQLGCGFVHVLVNVEGEVFESKKDLATQELADAMRCDPQLEVSTAAARVAQYVERIRGMLASRQEVLLLDINYEMSKGSRAAGASALEQLTPAERARVTIYDSETLGPSLGFLLIKALQLAAAGKGKDEIVSRIHFWKARIDSFYTTPNLDYAIKGGRVSASPAVVMMNNKAIIRAGFMFGQHKMYGDKYENKKVIAFSPCSDAYGTLLGKMQATMLRAIPADVPTGFCVVHTGRPDKLAWLLSWIRETFSVKYLLLSSLDVAITVNGGPGSMGCSWVLDPDDEVLRTHTLPRAKAAFPGEDIPSAAALRTHCAVPASETHALREGTTWAKWVGEGRVDSKALPVVLCPGGTGNGLFYHGFAAKLSESLGCRVLLWDRFNIGLSDRIAGVANGLELWTSQLAQLLDALGVARAHFVGLSLASVSVSHFALAHASRVASIAMVSPIIGGGAKVPGAGALPILKCLPPAAAAHLLVPQLYKRCHMQVIEGGDPLGLPIALLMYRVASTSAGILEMLETVAGPVTAEGVPELCAGLAAARIPVFARAYEGDRDVSIPHFEAAFQTIAAGNALCQSQVRAGLHHEFYADDCCDAVVSFFKSVGQAASYTA